MPTKLKPYHRFGTDTHCQAIIQTFPCYARALYRVGLIGSGAPYVTAMTGMNLLLRFTVDFGSLASR
jgi:hypothetical protein